VSVGAGRAERARLILRGAAGVIDAFVRRGWPADTRAVGRGPVDAAVVRIIHAGIAVRTLLAGRGATAGQLVAEHAEAGAIHPGRRIAGGGRIGDAVIVGRTPDALRAAAAQRRCRIGIAARGWRRRGRRVGV